AVSGKYWNLPETLPLGVPLDRVIYARSVDVNAPPGQVRQALKRLAGRAGAKAGPAATMAGATPASPAAGRSALRGLGDFYVNLLNLPDKTIGWFPWAYGAGLRLCRDWRPDLIFASGPPMTALLVARRLSDRLGLPWVAELRDRWADDPYADTAYPPWRLRLDHWLERRVLATATALVTVTEPWAEFYRAKYGKPVATIYNGYDPRDFDFDPALPTAPLSPHLVIGYTGGIYPGRRDPAPLFQALKSLGPLGEKFRVIFCGTDPGHVYPIAERAGVRHLVEVRPGVTNAEALEFQRRSDVLLLMQWNDPREQGNCPGKFFEYIGSLRPILGLGLENGVPATITRDRAAGFFLNDPPAIAAQLKTWLAEKEASGRIRSLPLATREGLSRTVQFELLEQFLAGLPLVREAARSRAA
ncbi:MAG TPA: glycosyltransferase, partial [Candidatus Sulfotelmatobacter sp.]|nr:glycosyltransferase [Candidatus Sulfotelmatobacter sp.]